MQLTGTQALVMRPYSTQLYLVLYGFFHHTPHSRKSCIEPQTHIIYCIKTHQQKAISPSSYVNTCSDTLGGDIQYQIFMLCVCCAVLYIVMYMYVHNTQLLVLLVHAFQLKELRNHGDEMGCEIASRGADGSLSQ